MEISLRSRFRVRLREGIAWPRWGIFLFLLGSIAFSACSTTKPSSEVYENKRPQSVWPSPSFAQTRLKPVVGHQGMVVSDDPLASEWGARILREGGNAIEAAVAAAFVLSVTRPHFAALGGGGFLLYCPAPLPLLPKLPRIKEEQNSFLSGEGMSSAASLNHTTCVSLDYRERAPLRITSELASSLASSRDGARAIAVPGVVAGLWHAYQKYGSHHVSWKKLLQQPIRFAREGVRVSGNMAYGARQRWEAFNSEAKQLFGRASSSGTRIPFLEGSILVQKNLASVLERVARQGRDGFYRGRVAQQITSSIQKAGGWVSLQDLAQYSVKERRPLVGQYRDALLVSMGPPSAGGTNLLQLFGYAEHAEKEEMFDHGAQSSQEIHALAHAMALSFSDRALHLGDPEFGALPDLLDPKYLEKRWKESFDRDAFHSPRTSSFSSADTPPQRPDHNTTHLSVMDRWGNAVALTTSVNLFYGSGFVPEGSGIVMNNTMDDFSLEPNRPNAFGLVGNARNAVAPGKTPLSSMTPTIVKDTEGENRIVIGAAGGPTITTSVFLSLFRRLRFGLSLPDAVGAPRFHQQWAPESLFLEQKSFSAETQDALTQKGYSLQSRPHLGRIHAIERFQRSRDGHSLIWGIADSRAEGRAFAE